MNVQSTVTQWAVSCPVIILSVEQRSLYIKLLVCWWCWPKWHNNVNIVSLRLGHLWSVKESPVCAKQLNRLFTPQLWVQLSKLKVKFPGPHSLISITLLIGYTFRWMSHMYWYFFFRVRNLSEAIQFPWLQCSRFPKILNVCRVQRRVCRQQCDVFFCALHPGR